MPIRRTGMARRRGSSRCGDRGREPELSNAHATPFARSHCQMPPTGPSYRSDRDPNMMMAIPVRLTATPTQSVVVGLTLSTSISHISATPT